MSKAQLCPCVRDCSQQIYIDRSWHTFDRNGDCAPSKEPTLVPFDDRLKPQGRRNCRVTRMLLAIIFFRCLRILPLFEVRATTSRSSGEGVYRTVRASVLDTILVRDGEGKRPSLRSRYSGRSSPPSPPTPRKQASRCTMASLQERVLFKVKFFCNCLFMAGETSGTAVSVLNSGT